MQTSQQVNAAVAPAGAVGKIGPSGFDAFRKKIGLPLAIGLALLITFLPQPEGLSLAGQKAIAIFTAVFVLYLTESIHLAVTSLAIIPAVVFTDTVKLGQVLPPYAGGSVFLMFGSFILAAAMVKTGLADRITFAILSKTGSSVRRITFGMVLVSMVLSFMLPSSTARTAILLPIALAVINLFNYQGPGRSKFTINILLTIAFVNAILSAGVLTGSPPNVIIVDFMVKAGLAPITYTQWLVAGFPPAALMCVITWWVMHIVFKPEKNEIDGGVEFIRERLESLGPITAPEVRVAVIMALTVLLWITGSWTKLDINVVCIATVSLFFCPVIGVLDWESTSKSVSWSVLLICGGGLSLGGILMQTGAAKWIALNIFNLLGLKGLGVAALLCIVIVVVQYLHILFATTMAMATAFVPILLELAKTAGIDPVLLALPVGMIISGYPLLMFYNTVPSIVVYGTGKLAVQDYVKVGPLLCGIACVVYFICVFTFWGPILSY